MEGRLSKWSYWMKLYLGTHCTARGLALSSIASYDKLLTRFRAFVEARWPGREPERVSARDVLEWVEHLRKHCHNGDSAVNRAVTVLKCFYRAIVAMGHLEPRDNPMAHFPKVKRVTRRFAETLDEEEAAKLILHPDTRTVIGLRDRAIMSLFYGTGIRASECSNLLERDVDLERRTAKVKGKGGDERIVPFNEAVGRALRIYRDARGPSKTGEFFVSRRGKRMSRGSMYERVRKHGQQAGLKKKVSPHRLRHACATALVRAGERLTTIQEMLGHRAITSTQIYVHMTAQDLRSAAERHPISALIDTIKDLLPEVRLNFQRPSKQMRI
jgi:site-specific recombinase XerD